MNDITVRRFEMCVRVAGFLSRNPMVFRKGSQGPVLVAQFKRAVDDIRGLVVKHSSGLASARQNARRRRTARQSLIDALDSISRCAAGIAVGDTGFAESFKLVRQVNDTELLVAARRFAELAAPLRSKFIGFEMPTTFVEDLNSKIKEFEQASSDHSASRSSHVATVELVDTEMQGALAILAQLDPIVSNKLADDDDLKAQWKNVRHVERTWATKKPEPAPVPTVVPSPEPVIVKPQPTADSSAAAA